MKLSAAARRGLLAFDEDNHARLSNRTDRELHLVYWQTITTLERAGLCSFNSRRGDYRLTDAGEDARDALTPTCESCGRPADVRLVSDSSTWCAACDAGARRLGIDQEPARPIEVAS